jgi:DNA-binding CsgD family transcriptional regulator
MAERAHHLATSLKDPEQLRKSGAAVAHLLTWIGDTDRAREWLDARLAESTDRDERARREYLWHLAMVEFWAGRWGVAREYADEVGAIGTEYGIESPDDFFPAALLALHEGDFARAMSLSARVLSAGDHPVVVKTHHGITGIYELWTGDPEAAIVHFERADESAAAAGSYDPSMRHWRAEHVEALLQVGRMDDATRLTDEWERAALRLDRQRVLALAMRCRGLIAAARGDIALAIGLLEGAVSRHRDVGDLFGLARTELALGVNRRRARQKRSAREVLEAALAGFESLGASYWAAAARAELARVGGRTRSAGLSPSELSVAALVAEGRTNREIASSLFLGERTVAGHLTHIYAKLGIRSRTELARQFASKVETS